MDICNLNKVMKIISLVLLTFFSMQFVSAAAMAAWGDIPILTPETRIWDSNLEQWGNTENGIALPPSQKPYIVDIEPINNQVIMIARSAKNLYARTWSEAGSWTDPVYIGGPSGQLKGKSQALESFGSNVMAVYSDNTNAPKYRIWDGLNWGAEASTLPLANIPYWMVLKKNPNSNEMVLVTTDVSFNVYAQIWDGDSWRDQILLETRTWSGLRGSIDVEYDSSGRAVVVWVDMDTKTMQYRIWDGVSWSVEGSAVDTASGDAKGPVWVELAADANSNNMVLVSQSSNKNIRSQVWDGSNWANTELLGVGNDLWFKNIDAAYDSSGNAIVVWNANVPETVTKYNIWNGVFWEADLNTADMTGKYIPRWLELEASPFNDEMILMQTSSNSKAYAQVWDGDSWGDGIELESSYAWRDGAAVDVEYF